MATRRDACPVRRATGSCALSGTGAGLSATPALHRPWCAQRILNASDLISPMSSRSFPFSICFTGPGVSRVLSFVNRAWFTAQSAQRACPAAHSVECPRWWCCSQRPQPFLLLGCRAAI